MPIICPTEHSCIGVSNQILPGKGKGQSESLLLTDMVQTPQVTGIIPRKASPGREINAGREAA